MTKKIDATSSGNRNEGKSRTLEGAPSERIRDWVANLQPGKPSSNTSSRSRPHLAPSTSSRFLPGSSTADRNRMEEDHKAGLPKQYQDQVRDRNERRAENGVPRVASTVGNETPSELAQRNRNEREETQSLIGRQKKEGPLRKETKNSSRSSSKYSIRSSSDSVYSGLTSVTSRSSGSIRSTSSDRSDRTIVGRSPRPGIDAANNPRGISSHEYTTTLREPDPERLAAIDEEELENALNDPDYFKRNRP